MHRVNADPDVVAIDPGVRMSCRGGWARLGSSSDPECEPKLRTFSILWKKAKKNSPGHLLNGFFIVKE